MSTLDTTATPPPPEDEVDTTTLAMDIQGHVPRSRALYFVALLLLALAWSLFGYGFYGVTFTTGETEWDTGILTLMFGVLHFITGIRIVDIRYMVGVYVLGYPTIQVSEGIICVPLGFFWITKIELQSFEEEFPTDPQHIWRGDESLCPPDQRPPIRIPFSDAHDNYPFGITNDGIQVNTDPLHRRSTNEVSFLTRWRVLDVFNFRRNIGTKEEARDQMEDIGVSFLNESLTKMPLSVALFNVAIINRHFEMLMRLKTRHWGIEIIDGRTKLIELSHSLNSSIQAIPENSAKAQAAKLLAEGERDKRVLEGEGAASAAKALAKAELDGRTDGLKRMKDELELDSADILAAETARSIGQSPSDKIIFGVGGLAEALGAGAAIAGAFKSKPEPKSGDTTP